ncbi:MAG: carbonic anhydrase [Myxococcota bacterium]
MRTLLDGHAAFRRQVPRDERRFLRQLASEGQSPDALYVGCSDSRVVPELLTASSPGALFVVRNVANLVPTLDHADASVGAALEYAVGHLQVQHVIVCGHYGCGGVRAAVDGLEPLHHHPSLCEWLRQLDPVVEALPPGDPDARWRAAVENSVEAQLQNLLSYPPVSDAVARGALEIHGWVYDMATLDLSVYDPSTDQYRPAREVLSTSDSPEPRPRQGGG